MSKNEVHLTFLLIFIVQGKIKRLKVELQLGMTFCERLIWKCVVLLSFKYPTHAINMNISIEFGQMSYACNYSNFVVFRQ